MSKPKTKPGESSDSGLIRSCIAFSQAVAAAEAAFKVDPTDSEFAEELDTGTLSAREEALKEMTTPATTVEGLRAKALVTPFVVQDAAGRMDEREEAFFLQFAVDMEAFLRPIAEEHFREALNAERAAQEVPHAA